MALAGTAAGVPQVGMEFDGSARGYRLMRQALPHLGRMSALRAFSGTPTYVMGAALLLVGHYGKKLFGGYDRQVQTQPQTMREMI